MVATGLEINIPQDENLTCNSQTGGGRTNGRTNVTF